MTTKEILHKYIFIIERVKRGDYPNLDTIREYVNHRFEAIDRAVEFSERTFLRDKNDIADLYGMEICYSRSHKGYYIEYLTDDCSENRKLEALNLFLTLSEANKSELKNLIIPDNKCQQGTENLFGLLHAIRNQHYVQLAYSKYYNDSTSIRVIAPYTIRESQGRWYLIGKDKDDGIVKVFGVDRISSLVQTTQPFKVDPSYSSESFFKHRFGVNAHCDYGSVEMVVLQVSELESKYILSKPIHPTQRVIEHAANGVHISVEVYPSYDFFMELLSYGPNIKVLSPQWVADEVKAKLKKALEQYL